MIHTTTIYSIEKDGVTIQFNSEKETCDFLGVAKCSVSSCYRQNCLCKGWKISKVGTSTHNETKTRLHKIWEGMHYRCENPNHKYYSSYGGRGIRVCDEWNEYAPFRDWAIKTGYNDNLTIDRVEVNGNYNPENCRWVTIQEQQNNKRSNRFVQFNGISHTISEWSEIVGIKKTTIKERLNAGWHTEKVLTEPVRKRTKGYRPSDRTDEGDNDAKCVD